MEQKNGNAGKTGSKPTDTKTTGTSGDRKPNAPPPGSDPQGRGSTGTGR
jgi:hypothetical protein